MLYNIIYLNNYDIFCNLQSMNFCINLFNLACHSTCLILNVCLIQQRSLVWKVTPCSFITFKLLLTKLLTSKQHSRTFHFTTFKMNLSTFKCNRHIVNIIYFQLFIKLHECEINYMGHKILMNIFIWITPGAVDTTNPSITPTSSSQGLKKFIWYNIQLSMKDKI